MNSLVKHVPHELKRPDVNGGEANKELHKDEKDKHDDNKEDIFEGDEDEEEEEEESDIAEDLDDEVLLISSDEEAELEAQRISFYELIGKTLLPNGENRIEKSEGSGDAGRDSCSSDSDGAKNAEVAIATTVTVTTTITATATATVVASEQHEESSDKALEEPLKTPQKKTAVEEGTPQSPAEQVETCGTVSVCAELGKLIMHCSFCDLSFGDVNIFATHFTATHKFLEEEEEQVHQTKQTQRQQRKSGPNETKGRARVNVKAEKSSSPGKKNAPSLLLPLHSAGSSGECCGYVYILNDKEIGLQCRCCNCKYANVDEFGQHLRKDHEMSMTARANEVHQAETNDPEFQTVVYVITELEPITESAQKSERLEMSNAGPMKEPNSTEREDSILILPTQTPETPPPDEEMLVREQQQEQPTACEQERERTKAQVREQKPVIVRQERKNHKEKKDTTTTPTQARKRKKTTPASRASSKRSKSPELSKPAVCNVKATRTKRVNAGKVSYKKFFPEEPSPLSPESIDFSKAFSAHVQNSPATTCTETDTGIFEDGESLLIATLTTVAERYQCNQCPKSFPKSSRLTEHKRLHTGEKPYRCDECGKRFRIKMRLVEHSLRHRKEKAFKCEICGLPLATKQDMRLHRRHHEDDRRHQCPECPKAFVRNSDLKIHVRVHTGEKPYVCEICQKSFRANQNLSVHRKSHLGEKNFSCEICNKKFMRNIDLKVHFRTHTGERPFRCEICNRGYSSRVHVRTHIAREHVPNANGTPVERKKPGPRPKPKEEKQLGQESKGDDVKQKQKKQQQQQQQLEQKIQQREGKLDRQQPTKEPPLNGKTLTKREKNPTPKQKLQQLQQQQRQQQEEERNKSQTLAMLESIATDSPLEPLQDACLGIQQVSVTVSMQVAKNVGGAPMPEKENHGALLAAQTPTHANSPLQHSVKKERKITSFFTVVGQQTEI